MLRLTLYLLDQLVGSMRLLTPVSDSGTRKLNPACRIPSLERLWLLTPLPCSPARPVLSRPTH